MLPVVLSAKTKVTRVESAMTVTIRFFEEREISKVGQCLKQHCKGHVVIFHVVVSNNAHIHTSLVCKESTS